MHIFRVIFCILFVSSCATTTPTVYQEYSATASAWGIKSFGYNSLELADKKPFDYTISIKLNEHSTLQQAHDYAKWRAAELAKEKNKKFFKLLVMSSEIKLGTQLKYNGANIGGPGRYPQVFVYVDFIPEYLNGSYVANDVLRDMKIKYPNQNGKFAINNTNNSNWKKWSHATKGSFIIGKGAALDIWKEDKETCKNYVLSKGVYIEGDLIKDPVLVKKYFSEYSEHSLKELKAKLLRKKYRYDKLYYYQAMQIRPDIFACIEGKGWKKI